MRIQEKDVAMFLVSLIGLALAVLLVVLFNWYEKWAAQDEHERGVMRPIPVQRLTSPP